MKKILITGKGSYLGNSLKAYLEAFGDCYQVDCLSLRSGDWKEQSFRGYDAVYHTAAIVHQPRSKTDPGELARYRAVNRDLAVAAAKKAKCAYIITRNKRDFANSPVPALTPGELLTL